MYIFVKITSNYIQRMLRDPYVWNTLNHSTPYSTRLIPSSYQSPPVLSVHALLTSFLQFCPSRPFSIYCSSICALSHTLNKRIGKVLNSYTSHWYRISYISSYIRNRVANIFITSILMEVYLIPTLYFNHYFICIFYFT